MLALDNPRWSTLSHCYGPASDMPRLLQELRSNPGPVGRYDAEPWASVWSSLCHQGDCFDASYAAVPHLVDIALNVSSPIDLGFFMLPASIEIARRNGLGPEIPADIAEDYWRALLQLNECVARHRHADWDEYMLISAMGALAVAKGHIRVAEAILNLDDQLIDKLIKLDFGK